MLLLLLGCGTPLPTDPTDPADADPIELLQHLGYIDGMVDDDPRSGVVVHDPQRASPGLNFYSSRKLSKAQLVDMEGQVVHTWTGPPSQGWQHATLLPNGDVIVLIKNKQVFRIDKNSKVLWRFKAKVHHDLDVLEDGTVYVLARRNTRRPKIHERSVVEDYVQVLSPKGKPLRQISILGALEESPYAFLINDSDSLTARHHDHTRTARRPFDVLHANHVEILDGSLAHKNPAFAKGNLLISTRTTHTPFVYDPSAKKIVWLWGTAALIYPHDPTVTPDGTVLIFNNGTKDTRSQIVEVDPASNDIVWTYGPTEHFFSATRGSNQRLPNGNTLITESDTGYVFEVARDGTVVWEFRNPDRLVKDGKQLRMAIWRMTRFQPQNLHFLRPSVKARTKASEAGFGVGKEEVVEGVGTEQPPVPREGQP